MSTTMEGVLVAQETEVPAKARRRRFTAAEKVRVLREADRCAKPGEVSALPRREGLYSSHLATWRAARRRGELAGLAPRARGPKAKPVDSRDKRLVEQAREIPFSGFGGKESAERARTIYYSLGDASYQNLDVIQRRTLYETSTLYGCPRHYRRHYGHWASAEREEQSRNKC
jgi:transposase